MDINKNTEGTNNSSDLLRAEGPAANKPPNELAVKPYSEVTEELTSSADSEPQELPAVRNAVRVRERFTPNTDESRMVTWALPMHGSVAEIELRRTSSAKSEGATLSISAIARSFGNEVVAGLPNGTQLEFVLPDDGKKRLVGYVLRRAKSVRVYVPLKYCAGIKVLPEPPLVQPVKVLALIIG